MKKIIALLILTAVILTAFAGCKGNWKGGELVTDVAGDAYAAVTKEDGDIVRDDSGNLIVLVTDKNGNNVKDENGEYATSPVGIEHAIQIGNRIEMPSYSIVIPDGWTTSESNYSMVMLRKTGASDEILIQTTDDKTLAGKRDENHILIRAVEEQYEDTKIVNKEVKLKEDAANLESAYSEANKKYIGFITYKRGNDVYSVRIVADYNVTEKMDDIVKILDTINYAR